MNKLMKPFVAIALSASLLLASCAGFKQNVETTLGSPQQVQSDVAALGAVARAHIKSDKVKADIHRFVQYLQQAADLDLSTLKSLIPKTGNVNIDAAILAATAYVDAAVSKWGSHNATALAYAHAVGNGLAQAGL